MNISYTYTQNKVRFILMKLLTLVLVCFITGCTIVGSNEENFGDTNIYKVYLFNEMITLWKSRKDSDENFRAWIKEQNRLKDNLEKSLDTRKEIEKEIEKKIELAKKNNNSDDYNFLKEQLSILRKGDLKILNELKHATREVNLAQKELIFKLEAIKEKTEKPKQYGDN